ncbi:MAG: glycosyltransferase family 2 protein [Alcanivorax sp.]|nr:MAG: glycosyltransferase family 2 protein [Alcanivorax sp.]
MSIEGNAVPVISVIVPLYNKGRYVVRALRSVLAQRTTDFEIIVIDDGSTDAGPKKAKAISDARIKLFSQENQGVAAARNTGVLLASGQWIAFLDADDLWGPDHLLELRRLISRFPDAGLVGASSREVVEGGDIEFLEKSSPGSLRRINYFEEAAVKIDILHTSSIAISRPVFDSLGGFSGYRYGEDLEFWARVALEYPVAKSDRPTVVYYRGNGGAMETLTKTASSEVPPPTSLADVSPSVAMLSTRLDDLPYQSELRMSVIGYINARLVQGMRGSFIRGDMPRMKALRALCLLPLTGWRQRGWWLLTGLPSVILSSVSRWRALFKKTYLKFKG